MNLNDKLRLFSSSERTDEDVVSLFSKVSSAQSDGVHIMKAIESSLNKAHKQLPDALRPKIHRDGNVVKYLIGRHKPILLELKGQGYGYGKIATILARRKIYNKNTNKAYSRQTIKNVFDTIKKEKDEYLCNSDINGICGIGGVPDVDSLSPSA